jgi:hypothetical protein
VLNSSGVLASVAVNSPAFEFNADGSYKGLLVEPGATNLATYSNQFDDASWEKVKATVTANNAISPDGTMNADRVVFNDGTSTVRRLITLGGATATRSVWVKGTVGETISIDDYFTTFEVVTLDGTWQRIGFTGVVADPTGFGISTFGGATARTIWLYGAQVELGSVATSYIPTVASTVARTADVVSLTGASSLIGQTEGTLYVEADCDSSIQSVDPVLFYLRTVSPDNQTFIQIFRDGRVVGITIVAGGVQCNIDAPSFGLADGTHKFALAYKENDFAFYIDGVQVGVDASGTVGSQAIAGFGYFSGSVGVVNYRSVALFPTRLSNSQLASLTTL